MCLAVILVAGCETARKTKTKVCSVASKVAEDVRIAFEDMEHFGERRGTTALRKKTLREKTVETVVDPEDLEEKTPLKSPITDGETLDSLGLQLLWYPWVLLQNLAVVHKPVLDPVVVLVEEGVHELKLHGVQVRLIDQALMSLHKS